MRTDVGALSRLVRAYGLKNTRRGLIFLATVAVFMHKTGQEPTVEALTAYWKQSERTTYRELAAFRKISEGQDHAVVARRVLDAYKTELLLRENPEVLALDVAQFVWA